MGRRAEALTMYRDYMAVAHIDSSREAVVRAKIDELSR